MHVDCWIQQVTTRVGAVTCWIQQSVSPKQVVGFSCLFNSEVDQLISKVIVMLTALFIFEYYSTHCTKSSEGHHISVPMHLPKTLSFSFVNAFFPLLHPVEAEDDPFWEMPN